MCVLLQDERLPAAHQSSEYREIPQNVCVRRDLNVFFLLWNFCSRLSKMKETISLAQKNILWRIQQQQLVPEQTHSEKTVFLIPFQSISDDFIQVFFVIFFFKFFFWQTTGCCFQFMSTSLCWSTTCNVATTATLRPNFVVRSLKFVWLVRI